MKYFVVVYDLEHKLLDEPVLEEHMIDVMNEVEYGMISSGLCQYYTFHNINILFKTNNLDKAIEKLNKLTKKENK